MKPLRALLASLVAFVSMSCPGPVFAQDAIDLSRASIASTSPADVGSWPATVHLDRLTFDPSAGLSFGRSGADWPDVIPPGFEGPIQYTVWACHANVCAGFIQMWRDRAATGAPLPSNWTFWWGPQSGGAIQMPFGGYQSQAGDTMQFFLTAGNARAQTTVSSLRERSNVVSVRLPANDAGVFDFPPAPLPAPAPVEIVTPPAPIVTPPVVTPPVPEPAPVVVIPSTPIVTPEPVPVPPSPSKSFTALLLEIVGGILGAFLAVLGAGALR